MPTKPNQEAPPVVARQPRFVARQSILTVSQGVFGYELLFRDGLSACFKTPVSQEVSSHEVDNFVLMGFDLLCNGSRAFLPCTADILRNEYIMLLPPAQTIVELLSDISADEDGLAICGRLKNAGYRMALTGFAIDDPREALTSVADILKVDFRSCDAEQRTALVTRYGTRCRLLADNLDSQADFAAAKQAGFSYFQGSFLGKPDVLPASRVPENAFVYLRMLQVASAPELNLDEIEVVVKSDPSVSYRLLRYLNSAVFGFTREIHTVREALTMLGTREIRHWLQLTAALGAGQNKPGPLLLAALARGRFCELAGSEIVRDSSDLFLVGILSLMDAILDVPMKRVLRDIPVSQECKDALLGQESRLRPIYRLAIAQEEGDWTAVSDLADEFHLSESRLIEYQWEAMSWASQMASGPSHADQEEDRKPARR